MLRLITASSVPTASPPRPASPPPPAMPWRTRASRKNAGCSSMRASISEIRSSRRLTGSGSRSQISAMASSSCACMPWRQARSSSSRLAK